MKTIWLLLIEQDYEGQEIHSLYKARPSPHALARLIKDTYGWAMEYGVIKDLATELCSKGIVRILNMYTWRLEERYVND